MAMNLNNLKIFINVADSGSITRAAEALFISQPAVSKAIRSIEDDLGVSLFYRDKKTGIKLTDTGERILPYARKMLLMEEKFIRPHTSLKICWRALCVLRPSRSE